jgi:hypothetical protein
MKRRHLIFGALAGLVALAACEKDNDPVSPPVETPDPEQSGCLPASLTTDLIAYYPFSNGSINDFSGNGMHLTNSTSAHAAPDRDGNPTCAFAFNAASGDFLETAQTGLLDGLSSFSVSLWYMPEDSLRADGDFEVLVSRGTGLSCPDRFGFWSVALYDCRKAVFGRLNSVWDQNIVDFTQGATCQDEVFARTWTWHHLVATYDNGEMKIYRDGVLQDVATGNAGCGGTPSVQDIGNLLLGKMYTGRLDDVLIYSRALNHSEVGSLFEADACCQ